ncbi:MAG: TonB-dependent receptor [Bacteroidales bacterium]
MRKMTILLSLFVFCGIFTLQSQTVQITGTVTSAEDGSSLPGVAVVLQGTSIGTVTDFEGRYSLDVPANAEVLVFSFVGMSTVEVPIEGRTVINVEMEPELLAVDEVIVVAYGTARRSSYTGSASTIRNEKLESIQVSDVSKVLEGMSSGLQTTSGLGQPGAAADIRIRGFGSVNADASPLFVVDGFPYRGNINTIPVSDIESITVLKDASATALYGSRGANGVILITTKTGESGEASFNFRANVGYSERGIPEYDRVTVPEYYENMWLRIYNEAKYVTNPGLDESAYTDHASGVLIPRLGGYNAYNVDNDQVVGADGNINPNASLLWTDDWYDELHRTGMRQDYLLSASGGVDQTTYFISANYLKDEGIVRASNFDRFSIRANAESQMRDWVKVGINLGGSTSTQNFPQSSGTAYVNSFMFSRMVAPIYPVYTYEPDGTPVLDEDGNKIPDYGATFGRARAYISNSNPLGTITLDTREYKRDALTSRGYVEFSFLNDFQFVVNASSDYYGYSGLTHQNAAFGDAQSFSGRSTRQSQRTMNFSSNQLLTWGKTFGDHTMDALVGHESTQYQFNNVSAVRTGFPFPGLVELDAAATAEGSNSYEHNHRLESYLSRFNYDFANRYYFSASYRMDGSSRFHPDYRWGNFWSVGASWRASEESFMENMVWLDNMVLRASYGALGNEALPSYYAYLGLYSTGWDNLGFPGLLASRLPTPELTWEKNNTTNLGIDFRLFNRLSVNVEYYIKESDGLLFEKPIPPSTGFSSIDANIGALKNTGIDVEINANLVSARNFIWNVDMMLSHFKNEITELPQDEIIVGSKRWEVGRSIYDFWIREYAGLDDEGRVLWYKDIIDGYDDDGEPIITGRETTDTYGEADRYYVGTSIPDLEGSFSSNMRVGNFDFSFMLTYGLGGVVLDGVYQELMHNGDYGTNWHRDILDSWTEDNTDAENPILIGDQNANGTSSRFLFDRDYMSIRNVSLGYNVPSSMLQNIGMTNTRVFVTGTNLYTFTSLKGMDPMQSFAGTQGYNYTPLRTVTFGVSMNF